MSEPGSMFAAFEPDVRRQALPAPLDVRQARVTDVASCARLTIERTGGDVVAWESTFRARVADPAALVVVADMGQIVGVGVVGWWEGGSDSSANVAPSGYYLSDLVVDPRCRRRGVGEAITRVRLAWVWQRDATAWYVANALNRPSLALHARLGFREVIDDVSVPGVSFAGGRGVLCRADRPPTWEGGPDHLVKSR